MDTNKKVKWVEDLRSGNRKQGCAALTRIVNGEQYDCCLGVLCDIARVEGVVATTVEGVVPEDTRTESTLIGYRAVNSGDVAVTGVLPYSVVSWAGLDDDNPVIPLDEEDRDWIFKQFKEEIIPFASNTEEGM
jgi:hypothetical protein